MLAVHNGLKLLSQKIDRLTALDYSGIKEVIVVSDGSTDGTAEFLLNLNHPLIQSVALEAHSGKAVAVNTGIARARGDLIVFTDLRPEIAPGALQQLINNFADPQVGCVGGEYVVRQRAESNDVSSMGQLYWSYERWLRNQEALLYASIGVPGCFYAVRRELVRKQPSGIILDDMYQPLSVIRQGYRCVVDPAAQVFDVLPERVEGEFHRKVRTLAGNFQLIQLAPWILSPTNRVAFQFLSHKIMRLVVPYFLITMFFSSIIMAAHSLIFAIFACIQILFWLLAISGTRWKIPLLRGVTGPASALLTLNAAAVVGLYKYLFTRGPLWKIWNTGRPAEASLIDLGT